MITLKRVTFFGWHGAITLVALALINDLLLFRLTQNLSQIGFVYAALMIFVRWASLGHFVGSLVDAIKQRRINPLYPGLQVLVLLFRIGLGPLVGRQQFPEGG